MPRSAELPESLERLRNATGSACGMKALAPTLTGSSKRSSRFWIPQEACFGTVGGVQVEAGRRQRRAGRDHEGFVSFVSSGRKPQILVASAMRPDGCCEEIARSSEFNIPGSKNDWMRAVDEVSDDCGLPGSPGPLQQTHQRRVATERLHPGLVRRSATGRSETEGSTGTQFRCQLL
jgi:hypothetical protein